MKKNYFIENSLVKSFILISFIMSLSLLSACKSGSGDDSKGTPKPASTSLVANPSNVSLSLDSTHQLIIQNTGSAQAKNLQVSLNPKIGGLTLSGGVGQSSLSAGDSLTLTFRADHTVNTGDQTTLAIRADNANSLSIPVVIKAPTYQLSLTANSDLMGAGETKTYQLKNNGDQTAEGMTLGVFTKDGSLATGQASISDNQCLNKVLSKNESCSFKVVTNDSDQSTDLVVKAKINSETVVAQSLSVVRPVLSIVVSDSLVNFQQQLPKALLVTEQADQQAHRVTIIPGLHKKLLIKNSSPVAVKSLAIQLPAIAGVSEDKQSNCQTGQALAPLNGCIIILDGSLQHLPAGSDDLVVKGSNADSANELVVGSASSANLVMASNYHLVISQGLSQTIPLVARNLSSESLTHLKQSVFPVDQQLTASSQQTCVATLTGKTSCDNSYVYQAAQSPTPMARLYSLIFGNTISGGQDSSGVLVGVNTYKQFFSTVNLSNQLASNAVNQLVVANHIYYAATDGGLSISHDNGAHWFNRTTADGLANDLVWAVDVSGKRLLAATDSGLSISDDSGETWKTITTQEGLPSNVVTQVNSHNQFIAVGTLRGLSISRDGGKTFQVVKALGTEYVNTIQLVGNSLFVLTSSGLWRSDDWGVSWSHWGVKEGLPASSMNGSSITNSHWYVTTESALSVSSDNGVSWHTVTLPVTDLTKVTAAGSWVLVGSSHGLALSNDYGQHWTILSTTQGLGSNEVLNATVNGNQFFAATRGGLSISQNLGATWSNLTRGASLPQTDLRDVVVVSDGTVLAATDLGVGVSRDNGLTWTMKTSSDGLAGNDVLGLATEGNTVYAAINQGAQQDDGGLSISTDSGKRWHSVGKQQGLSSRAVSSVAVSGKTVLVGTDHGLGMSHDGGQHFTMRNVGLGTEVSDVFIHNNMYYVSTDFGVAISSDGKSWQHLTSGSGLAGDYVHSFRVVNGTWFVSTDQGLSISSNQGQSWQTVTMNNGLGSNNVYRVQAVGKTLYASTENGLSFSDDNGASWKTKTLSDGLSGMNISSIAEKKDGLYVATDEGLDLSGVELIKN